MAFHQKMPAYRSFQLPESSPHYPRQKDVHLEHFKIEMSLNIEKKSIMGTCSIRLSPLRPGLRKVSLDASMMEIRSTSFDGEDCTFEYDNEKLSVVLPSELKGSHYVTVSYSSTPTKGIYFVGPDAEHPEKEVQVWTQNEAEFARHWFPCHDSPDEKSSSELLLTVPNGFRAISNGELLSTKEVNGQTVYHWKEELPHPTYLTSFVVGRFGEITQESEGIPLHYYFPEYKRNDALRYFGETPRMISVFTEITGVKYPYKKYDQTTVEDFIYGGMENFNATTLAMNYYPDAGSEEDFQTSYATPHTNAVNLVAHELAHMWFGDLVTCSDWSHGTLNEGFATYLQGLYLERTKGADEFRWDMAMRADQYFEEDKSEYRRAIVERSYVFPDDVFDYTLYEKGEWMLHELRYLMGDAPFFAGIKEYLTRNAFGSADVHDLRRAMERVSGFSLEEFFEQAFMEPGFPEFEVGYEWDEAAKTAVVSVRQVQRLEQGTPIFKLPCDLVFYNSEGRHQKRVKIDKSEQAFSFELGSRPRIVEFDPRHWLLKKVKFSKPLELLLNQLAASEDASSRAEAARALGDLKSNLAVNGLREAAAKEQFWEVPADALKALGEIGTPEALDALTTMEIPKHRRVRRGLAAALGNFKDDSAVKSLTGLLQNDVSPYVRCEAALSLAKSWPGGALPLLKQAMTVSTPNETLAEACLEAMGKLKDEEIAAIIRENLKYGRPARARIGAMKAIKKRGHFLDEEIPVIKEILLHDREFRVRQYAASSLVKEVGDRRLLDSVKEASEQDKDPRVRRKAMEAYYEMSTSAATSTKLEKLGDEIEKLKEQNRQLSMRGTAP